MNLSTRGWTAGTLLAIVVASCAPSAQVTEEEAAGVLRAYAAQAANAGRSFHLVQTATFSAGGQSGDARYELDVSGSNVSGVLNVVGETFEIRVVDGAIYANIGGGWQALPADTGLARDMLDFFRYVGDAANLRAVERVEEGGAAVFHFRAINPVPYQTSEMRDLGVTGSIPELDFYVRQDGVPVRMTFRSTAQQGTTTIETRSTVEFSRWGEPITIQAPK